MKIQGIPAWLWIRAYIMSWVIAFRTSNSWQAERQGAAWADRVKGKSHGSE